MLANLWFDYVGPGLILASFLAALVLTGLGF
jgi:hypothetical protein